MGDKKNVCPECGGQLVCEYIGSYGDVFLLDKNGEPYKRRLRRMIYEHDGDEPMIYCKDCGHGISRCGQE